MNSLLFLLALFLVTANAGKVLIYSPSYSLSHLISNGRIADTLVGAGHDVVVFIPEFMTLSSDFNGTKLAKVVRMRNISSAMDEVFTDEDQKRLMIEPTFSFYEKFTFEYASAELCSALMKKRGELEKLKNYGFDVAFSEQLDFCGIGLIRYLGIHNLLWISSTPIMDPVSYDLGIPAPTSYVPSIQDSDCSDVMSFWDRASNTYKYLEAILLHRIGTDQITKVFRKIDPNFPNVREIAANASLSFVNADEMFDFARPIIHKNIYIGGLGVGEPKPLNERFTSLMSKGKEGVIIFSLGTVAPFHAFPENVKINFASVFKSMPGYHFILKIARGDNTTQLLFKGVSNCDCVEWLPQSDILAHPRLRLFVMHGGVNGLMEAMIRGVPVVVIPIFGDQFRNGRNAEKRGTGKTVLLKQQLTEDNIRGTIREVLDSRYKKNALRMARLMKEKPFSAEERLVKWTSFAIENGVLEELHVQGSRLNFFVYYNLDVIAAAVLLSCIFIFIFVRICISLAKIFTIRKRKVE